jgi:hypothetical protein
VKEIAASDYNSYALLADGTVRAVGYNGYGALGMGTINGNSYSSAQSVIGLTDVIDIDAAGLWCAALRSDSTVWVWGGNTWGQLGLAHYNAVAVPTQVPGLASIKQIAAGVDNLYALRSDGRILATGYGPAIGIGWDGGSSNIPQLLALTNVRYVDGGSSYAMAVMSDGRLKAWGLNAGSYPGINGVLGTEWPYVIGNPIDIPNVFAVTSVGAGWGTMHAFGQLGVTDVTPIAGTDGPPTVLALAATPNPARDVSAIHFDLPRGGAVTLAVFDVAGRLVRTLADEAFEPGRHVRPWDGRTNAGPRASAGVYFAKLVAPGGALTKTLVRVE